MLMRMIYDDRLAQAAYLIGCQRTGEALIIDPERDIDRYIEAARAEGLAITAIAETHIHADFISGARELAERTGAKLYLSGEGGSQWQYEWLHDRLGGGSYRYHLLHHGDMFVVGKIQIEALHTPGHTAEHMSYLVTDLGGGIAQPIGIATGDFIFVGDVGRPDLLESAAGIEGAAEPAARQLHDSLLRFNNLPDYVQIWPGHGAGSACGKALGAIPQSTVGYERRFNPAFVLAQGDEEEFIAMILSGQPEPPPYFAVMKRENKNGPALLRGLPRPPLMETGIVAHRAAAEPDLVVVDTRSWPEFREGHLERALHVPLDRSFPTVAGSYIEPDEKIVLVVDRSRLDEAITLLVRIGLDNIIGFIPPNDLASYFDAGGEPVRTAEVEAAYIVHRLDSGSPALLDVRGAVEFHSGHVPGGINIAHTRLAPHIGDVPTGSPLFVHCRSGARSAVAVAYLQRRGFDAVNVRGGYIALCEAGVGIESGSLVAQTPCAQ